MFICLRARSLAAKTIKLKLPQNGFRQFSASTVLNSIPNTEHSGEEFLTSPFRCAENNPINHKVRHEGQFYTVPPEDYKRLCTFNVFAKEVSGRIATFNELSIMVRKPALEVINCIENTNFSHPANRYVLYGVHGSGKSYSMAHVLHYLSCKEFLLLHIPWVPMWVRLFKDTAPSVFKPGRVDLPVDAVVWLQHFKLQNHKILQTIQPTISNTYTWSKRELSEKGSLLADLIEQGINRPKFSSDCVGAILKEVKILANSGVFKVATVIDGVNAMFHCTRIKRDDRSIVEPDEITLIHAFRKMLNNDYKNGVIVTSVDTIASPSYAKSSYLPRYLLTKKGFEILDPFLPVFVDNYSKKEIYSCLDYYNDRKWIQSEKGKTEDGRQQLMFLSGYNPGKLIEYCSTF